jgi:hypothetical protein
VIDGIVFVVLDERWESMVPNLGKVKGYLKFLWEKWIKLFGNNNNNKKKGLSVFFFNKNNNKKKFFCFFFFFFFERNEKRKRKKECATNYLPSVVQNNYPVLPNLQLWMQITNISLFLNIFVLYFHNKNINK